MYKKTLKSVSKKKSKALKYGRGFLKPKHKNEIPTSTKLQNLDNRVIELELSTIPNLVQDVAQSKKNTNENISILNQTQKYQFQTLSGELEMLSGELENIKKELKLFRHDLRGMEKNLNLKEWKKD